MTQTLLRSVSAVVTAVLVSASPAWGQSVRGTVTEEGTTQPVVGAFVVLVDAEGADRAAALTDDRGRYALQAPAPGGYRLRADRIGYHAMTSPLLELRTAQSLDYDITVPIEAVNLQAIAVETERECNLAPAEAARLSAVWEEARKALAATSWTQREEKYRLTVRQYERSLGGVNRRVREESSRTQVALNSSSPFVSLPADQLAEQGYARRGDTTTQFFGPDAEALLSATFVEGHCFRLKPADGEHPGMIGLAFEPEREREVTDIEGVLWLDAASNELRRLEYSYTGFPATVRDEDAGGRIEFERLPSGAWIVSSWWIRAPGIVQERQADYEFVGGRLSSTGPVRLRERVASVTETGGQIDEIRTLAGHLLRSRETAGLAGSVTDSTLGGPLAGAVVALEGTAYRTVADSAGRFRFGGLAGGRFTVTVRHPRIDSLAIPPLAREVVLTTGMVRRVDLALPSLTTLLARACGERSGTVPIVGFVRDSLSDVPLPEARIVLTWQPADGGPSERLELDADRYGRYAACDVSVGATVTARAEFLDRAQREVFRVPETAAVRRDFFLSDAPLTSLVVVDRRDSGETAGVAGRVVDDATGAPLAGAQVVLAGTGRGAVADAAGAFRLSDAPAGSHTLEVQFLGYVTARAGLVLGEEERLSLAVRLVRAPISAEPIEASITEGGEDAWLAGMGPRRITAQDIARYPSMPLIELISYEVPNVLIGEDAETGCQIPIFRAPNSMRLSNAPLVVLEGTPLANPCELESINPEDIERLDIVSGMYGVSRWGEQARNGMILVTIKDRIEHPDQPTADASRDRPDAAGATRVITDVE